jgi:hypothetical protein
VSSSAGTTTVTFTTPFPSGPAIVVEATWVFPGGGAPGTLPSSPLVVHTVGPSAFSVVWTAFGLAAPITYEIHWTARQ